MTAPDELLDCLRGLSTKELVSVAARFRLADDPRDVPSATKFAIRSVARRYETLSEEIAGAPRRNPHLNTRPPASPSTR